MTRIEKLIKNRVGEIWGIHPDATVYDAIRMMDEKGIGAVVVLLDGELIGIMSERDYARKVALKDRSSKETQVKEIMSRSVFHTFPEQSVDECMAVMTKHRIRHLPVLQDNKVIGMVTIGDLVKDIIAEQQDKIEHLEHCITWGESY